MVAEFLAVKAGLIRVPASIASSMAYYKMSQIKTKLFNKGRSQFVAFLLTFISKSAKYISGKMRLLAA